MPNLGSSDKGKMQLKMSAKCPASEIRTVNGLRFIKTNNIPQIAYAFYLFIYLFIYIYLFVQTV